MYRLKSLIIFFVIVALTACDVLDQQPQQSLPVEGGLDSVEEIQNALTGAYDRMQQWPGGDNSAQILFGADIIAEDAFWTGSFPTYVEISEQAMTAQNGSIENHWDGAYEAINSANIIIESIEQMESPSASQEVLDDIRGQALFIRALQHYYLVQTFALPYRAGETNPGVPLQLEAVTSSEDFQMPSRASVGEVYSQILSDLQTAEGLISNTIPNRATSGAATALRARIALIQQRWADAASLSGQVIPNYTLLPSVTTFFRDELSSESIFEIENTVQDNPGASNTTLTAVYNEDSRDDIQVSSEFVAALDQIITDDQQAALDAAGLTATDTRRTELLTGTTTPEEVGQATAADNSTKYESIPNEEDNLPVLRLSEMLLTRAEALTEDAANLAAVPQQAFDDLNQIRTRAIEVTDANGDPANEALIEYNRADFTDKQELIDAIILERRVELAFEGHRLTDLQRRGLDVRGTSWDSGILTFPIPQSQIDANDNIQQNPAYQ